MTSIGNAAAFANPPRILVAKCWKDVCDIASVMMVLRTFAFRGLACRSWSLSSSFERLTHLPDRTHHKGHYLHGYEKRILWTFQQQAHRFLAQAPTRDQTLEWLAIIQHHGGPTRLVDFTYSLYVAAYFASLWDGPAEVDGAIWAVNLLALLLRQFPNGKHKDYFDASPSERYESYANTIHNAVQNEVDSSIIVRAEPERLDERMAAQQALFLFPCHLEDRFEQVFVSSLRLPVADLNETSLLPFERSSCNGPFTLAGDDLLGYSGNFVAEIT